MVRVNGMLTTEDKPNVFRSLEQQAEEQRLRVLEARMVAAAAAVDDHQVGSKPKHRSPGFALSAVLTSRNLS